LNKIIENR
jgi:hypothetical protein